jgi:hypothetical protein
MATEESLADAIADFVDHFWTVFENDWEFTESRICDRGYIAEGGTFLNPKVVDQGDNWGNRAGLLESYKRLQEVMQSRGIISPFLPVD